MQPNHWTDLPAGAVPYIHARPVVPLVAHVAFHIGPRGLLSHLPKARHARTHTVGDFRPGAPVAVDYRCQEKLNGVYVCWDGQTLWTKTGNPIANVPTAWKVRLPPGFALVGELFLGNGHREFNIAATLSRGQLPSLDTLESGSSENDRSEIWRHVRIVAFDMPGREEWPYAARYELLCTVVGAWSDSQTRGRTPEQLPLQVIRQHKMEDLPDLFREVVHGVPYTARKFPAHGVPRVRDTGTPLARRLDGWMQMTAPMFEHNECSSGEGVMLWLQTAPWKSRGNGGKETDAILKYKPIVLTVGTVEGAVRHSHGGKPDVDGDADGDGSRLPGYRVRVRWVDRWTMGTRLLSVYIPAASSLPNLGDAYRQGSVTFFIFYMFGNQPMFLRAIGSVLPHWDAVRVQQAVTLSSGSAPNLEGIRTAERWNPGEMRPFWPVTFAWSVDEFRRCAGVSRRFAASTIAGPDGLAGARNLRQMNREEREQRKKLRMDTRAAITAALHRYLRVPLAVERAEWVPNRRTMARQALCIIYVVAAWLEQDERPPDWWTRAPAMNGHLLPLERWGPFRIEDRYDRKHHQHVWVHGMLRATLTILAAIWARVGQMFREHALKTLRVLGATEVQNHVRSLEQLLVETLHEFAIPWNDPAIVSAFSPQRGGDLLACEAAAQRLTVETFLVFILERGMQVDGDEPPLGLMLWERTNATKITEIVLDPKDFNAFCLKHPNRDALRVRGSVATSTDPRRQNDRWRPDPEAMGELQARPYRHVGADRPGHVSNLGERRTTDSPASPESCIGPAHRPACRGLGGDATTLLTAVCM